MGLITRVKQTVVILNSGDRTNRWASNLEESSHRNLSLLSSSPTCLSSWCSALFSHFVTTFHFFHSISFLFISSFLSVMISPSPSVDCCCPPHFILSSSVAVSWSFPLRHGWFLKKQFQTTNNKAECLFWQWKEKKKEINKDQVLLTERRVNEAKEDARVEERWYKEINYVMTYSVVRKQTIM